LNRAGSPAASNIEPDILTFDPAEMLQRLPEGSHIRLRERVVLGERDQHADTAHPLGLLAMPHKRPCCGPAEYNDESAPPHSIS
jgi:hypothetical protein